MATSSAKPSDCKLENVQALELEDKRQDPRYTGLVVSGDMLMVVDGIVHKVALHSCHDGRLLATSEKLQSGTQDICVVKETEILVMVTLDNGKLEILSVESTAESVAIKRVRTLDVRKGFDKCDGVRPLRLRGKLVVSGVKCYMDTREEWICWGVVSHLDGHVSTTHRICKGSGWSYLATSPDEATIYISCYADQNSPDNGVYAFGVMDGRRKFFYRDPDLKCPQGISVERKGFVYVCNWIDPPCIHQLTEGGELVTVHREGIPPWPLAIYWDAQQEKLFITNHESRKVRRFHPLNNDPVIPAKVLNMDARSLDMYKEALKDGKEKVYNIRVMVVGQYGVGKTTLIKRLLGKDINISERQSTEGIDVHIDCCKVSLATREWTTQEENAEKYSRLQRLVKFLNERVPKQDADGKQKNQDEMHEHDGPLADQMVDQPVQSKPSIVRPNLQDSTPKSQLSDKATILLSKQKPSRVEQKKDAVMEIFQLVNENVGKLQKSVVEYAALAMWDFAGQYVFYTTHQAFLTSSAVYLLVIDLNQQVTGLVKDECFLDVGGIKPCKVHDLVEIWLNSIHYCAQSTETGITPVILVGTHVDKIPEKSRQNVIDGYYNEICEILKDKPSKIHLMGYIAIDNTKCDPKLEELKRKIFELASQQPQWGEEKPARWIPLEEAIMTLKNSGVKVAPLSLIEEINSMGSVRIESSEELNLFLKFQHEMGTILFFSVEGLREKIVLNPQWLIDALKSLITAEMFIRSNRAITSKWYEFKEKGKLTQELIDAVWKKEKNSEFYDNKEHILLVMEKLNIITRTRSFSEDGKEIEMEDYFLAPCMLRQEMPKEVISPKPRHQMESSSVLCYVFIEKFLPPPIFHRLLAACLDCWPIAKEGSQHLIYCGCCVFRIDQSHKLTLYTRNYIIFVRVTRVDKRMPSSKLCISVREFIEEMLSKIINYLCHSLAFECCIKCPESSEDCLEGVIPVSRLNVTQMKCPFHGRHLILSHELKKFWFHTEESQGNKRDNSVSSLPPNLQDKKPSERELGRLSMKIGKEFVLLGLELGITWVDIQQIQMDYRYTATQCLMFLYRWTLQSRDRATFRNLEKACRSAEIDLDIHKSISITGKRAYWPPQENLDKQPEDQHLQKICHKIGKEYVHLGVELGVPVSRIEQIQMEHPHDVPTQCFKILREWRQNRARQATFSCLEDAFYCIGIDPSILDKCVK